jgi:hypothetical protein
MTKTSHDIAVALAAAAIILFLIGFSIMIVGLVNTYGPQPSLSSMSDLKDFFLGVIVFEACSALPCAIISFAIKVSE